MQFVGQVQHKVGVLIFEVVNLIPLFWIILIIFTLTTRSILILFRFVDTFLPLKLAVFQQH